MEWLPRRGTSGLADTGIGLAAATSGWAVTGRPHVGAITGSRAIGCVPVAAGVWPLATGCVADRRMRLAACAAEGDRIRMFQRSVVFASLFATVALAGTGKPASYPVASRGD